MDTFREFVRSVIPGVTNEEADFILWERTPFPLVRGRDDLMPYLAAYVDPRPLLPVLCDCGEQVDPSDAEAGCPLCPDCLGVTE